MLLNFSSHFCYFQPFGCLLATTTSFLALLSPVPGQVGIYYLLIFIFNHNRCEVCYENRSAHSVSSVDCTYMSTGRLGDHYGRKKSQVSTLQLQMLRISDHKLRPSAHCKIRIVEDRSLSIKWQWVNFFYGNGIHISLRTSDWWPVKQNPGLTEDSIVTVLIAINKIQV